MVVEAIKLQPSGFYYLNNQQLVANLIGGIKSLLVVRAAVAHASLILQFDGFPAHALAVTQSQRISQTQQFVLQPHKAK